MDGNKRTGTAATLAFLDMNGLWFGEQAGIDDALEALVFSIAQGEADKAVIATFFRENCVKK
ncbi:hypothetical protein FACS1894170_13410 [Planctomycetales bacterium]|nr:hypothetical protein FACS1894170_13410 [Planctomycetales bacterium]